MYESRRIIIMIVGFILAFFLLLVASFFIYPVINPDANMGYNESEIYLYDYAQFGPQAVADLKKKVDALELELNEKRAKEAIDLALIDSLYQVTLGYEDQLMSAQVVTGSDGISLPGLITGYEAENDPRIIDVSKSLMRLDEEELAPILNRLTDPMLYSLYQATKGAQREKLLRSLEPAKSAVLLKRVMS